MHVRFRLLDERGDEVVVDRVLDDEALAADAALAGVLEARLRGGLGGGRDVGVGEHDVGVGAAELEHVLLERAAALGRDRHAGRLAAGERHGGDAVVGDELLHLAARHDQRREGAGGKPASRKTSSMASAQPVTLLACLSTPTLPAISAGAAKRNTCQNGKFHGITASTTPSGW